MARLDWLTARPLAHRGLHDAKAGLIENTPTAVRTAVEAGYGVEVDLQITADGEAVVHHDDALGRLTEGSGRLAEMTVAALKAVPFKATGDRIVTLHELCALVAGRATMALELKSRFDGDLRLVARAVQVLADYNGPVAVMSFDPDLIEATRKTAPALTRGIIAERHYDWGEFPPAAKRRLAFLLHAGRTRPQFVAYAVRDLPALAPLIARNIFGLPLLTWTVRSDDDRRIAARYADQIIFEKSRS
ncbi:MAG TPA: glycerophosphodiester phosphodiesterase family protein [Pseudolabrys sp.]|nr:glycerophosphodiester phosphodiesterase family protein [Pseudolabrys sp.]